MVTDSHSLSTLVYAGAVPRNIEAKQATELQGWITQPGVFRVLMKMTTSPHEPDIWISQKAVLKVRPFGVAGGDCLFEATGKLRFFSGARGGRSSDELMVLSNFPLTLKTGPYRNSGVGVLNRGRTAGALTSGDIEWYLVAVNEVPNIGDLDKNTVTKEVTKTVPGPPKNPFDRAPS
jgi:hypothetical protein